MIAEARSFTFLANEGSVKVPFFQRPYVWDEDNWEEMLTYLLEPEMNHFIGSIILKQSEAQSGRAKHATVVDGQQRLTTLSIMLCALYDSFIADNDLDDIKKEIETFNACLFYTKDIFDTRLRTKIEHSRTDHAHYQDVVVKDEKMLEEINSRDFSYEKCKSQIIKCYCYFIDRFKNEDAEIANENEKRITNKTRVSLENRKKLFHNLLNPNKKIMVVIDIHNADSEQRIYDTLNSGGKRLSFADTVKHQLYQKALDLGMGPYEVNQLYKDTWENVFEYDDDARAFWSTEVASGHTLANIEWLLKDIAVIKGCYKARNTYKELLGIYWDFINTLNEKSLRQFAYEIAAYAKIYHAVILPTSKDDLFCYGDYKKRLQQILNTFEIRELTPYILYLYHTKKDESALKAELLWLETMVMRNYICDRDKLPDNARLSINLIHDNEETKKKLLEDGHTDNAFIDALRNITANPVNERTRERGKDYSAYRKTATLALFWLELYRRSEKDPKYFDIDSLKYDYTLEHVMPIGWKANPSWSDKSVPILGIDGNPVEGIEKDQYRDAHVHNIGNLTLLKGTLNRQLENHSFKTKVYAMSNYADLWITSVEIIEYFHKNQRREDAWNEARIRSRGEAMIKDILEMWPLV